MKKVEFLNAIIELLDIEEMAGHSQGRKGKKENGRRGEVLGAEHLDPLAKVFKKAFIDLGGWRKTCSSIAANSVFQDGSEEINNGTFWRMEKRGLSRQSN